MQDVRPTPAALESTVMPAAVGPMAAAVALAAAQAAMTAAERAAAEIAEFRAHLGGDSVHVEVDPEAPPAIKTSPSVSGGDGAAPKIGRSWGLMIILSGVLGPYAWQSLLEVH